MRIVLSALVVVALIPACTKPDPYQVKQATYGPPIGVTLSLDLGDPAAARAPAR